MCLFSRFVFFGEREPEAKKAQVPRLDPTYHFSFLRISRLINLHSNKQPTILDPALCHPSNWSASMLGHNGKIRGHVLSRFAQGVLSQPHLFPVDYGLICSRRNSLHDEGDFSLVGFPRHFLPP